MPDREVHLNPAFVFVCEDCGRDTYVRPVAIEDPTTAEKLAQLIKDAIQENDPDWGQEQVVEIPSVVKCDYCEASFKVAFEELDLSELADLYDFEDGEEDEFDSTWLDSDDEYEDDDEFDDFDVDEDDDYDNWE